MAKDIKSWNCKVGDIVMFVLDWRTKFVPGKFFWGKVISRPSTKLAVVESGHLEKVSGHRTATVHVSCIRIQARPVKKDRPRKPVERKPIQRKSIKAVIAKRKKVVELKNKIRLSAPQHKKKAGKKGGKNTVGSMTFEW